MANSSIYKSELWPNGEFRLWLVPPRRPRPQGFEEKRNHPLRGIDGSNSVGDWDERPAPAPLDLTKVRNSRTGRKTRGQSGLTKYARRFIRNSAYLLELDWGRPNLSFFTLTMPGSMAEHLQVHDHIVAIMKNFKERLLRLLEARGLPKELVSVLEPQPKRLREHEEIGWHLHGLFVGKLSEKENWRISPAEIRKLWKEAICYFVPSLKNRNWGGSCDLKSIRTSAGNYLAKYLAKGKEYCRQIREKFPDIQMPTSWYVISAPLRSLVRGLILRRPTLVPHFLREIENNRDVFLYVYECFYETFIRSLGEKMRIFSGWVGRLPSSATEQLYLDCGTG